jgi:cobalamin biosynthesis Co2+ chelatase CbiK
MTDNHLWVEGKDHWYQYVKLNGYAFEPNEEGLKKLSKDLDISVRHLKKCINIYLES